MTLIIAGLFHDPALSVAPGDADLHAFCYADSLGSTLTAEGGLKIASKHRRKIHAIKPEVHVPKYHGDHREGFVTRPIIPLGLAHAGNVYLTSTILIEFESTLRNLHAVRGSVDRERKLVPPWHPDAASPSGLGDDPHLSDITPRSNMSFFAHLLQIHIRSVIEDAKEVFGPALHAGKEEIAFALLGYCETAKRVMAHHLDLERQTPEPTLPTVRCRELNPGQIVVLGLTATERDSVMTEVLNQPASSSGTLAQTAQHFCADAIAHQRFKGVGGYLTEGHVTSNTGFHVNR